MSTLKKTFLSIAIIILFIKTAYSFNPSILKKEFKIADISRATVVTLIKVNTPSF